MLTKSQEHKLQQILEKAKEDQDVMAVILFGSRVNDTAREAPDSDLDICLVLEENGKTGMQKEEDRLHSHKRLQYLAAINPEKIDLQIFQELPIYVKQRILAEGRVEYCRDKDSLYRLAYRTIQEYEDFAPRMEEYLEGVKGG